jgi:autophagy-related protein 9
VIFFAGAVLAVILVFTIYDEDVLSVQHVLAILSIAGTHLAFYTIFFFLSL